MKSSILTDDLKRKHQIFTPEAIVNKMIKAINKSNVQIFNCNILENSCGNGNILVRLVEEIIKNAKLQGLENEAIICLLQNNVHAYEIDNSLIEVCINRIDELCKKYGISGVVWDIKNRDFLTDTNNNTFDIIIGNPPYISYLDLPEDKRMYLKDNFISCNKGKFDYSYAFIEKSYNLLSENGLLIYLVPSNWFKNVYAANLRSLLIKDIIEIIDYQKRKIFNDVLVSASIIVAKKESNANYFKYICPSKKIYKTIDKTSIKDKWIFSGRKTSGKLFSDGYEVFVSIATLCNSVFVLDSGIVDDSYFYYKDYKIELELTRPAYSPKDKKYSNDDKRIIFPYFYKEGQLNHFTEEDLKNSFPFAYKYLYDNKDKLLSRDSDANAKWFEYGRSQAVTHMNKEMCIISSIISDETNAYLIKTEEIPYSGICIVPKGKNKVIDALSIINNDRFRKYAQSIGVSINGNSKRISPNDIKNYVY